MYKILILILLLNVSLSAPISYAKKTINGFDTTLCLQSSINTISIFNEPSSNVVGLKPSASLLLPNNKTQLEISMLLINSNHINYKQANLILLQPYWKTQSLIFCPTFGLNLTWLHTPHQKAQGFGPTITPYFEYLFLDHSSLSCQTELTFNRTRHKSSLGTHYSIQPSLCQEFCLNFAKHSPSFNSYFKTSLGIQFSHSTLLSQQAFILKLIYSL
jgi:hypothetical protein